MTDEELRKIAEEATPGPWWVGDPQPFVPGAQIRIYHESGSPIRISGSDDRHVWVSSDGAFIATFNPETVLALLDRVETAERAIARVRDRHQPCLSCLEPHCFVCEKAQWPCAEFRALEGDDG